MLLNLVSALAFVSTAAPAAERVSNETLGISVERPSGWRTLTAAENRANIGRVEMGSPQFVEAVQRYASAPLFAFTRHPEPHPELNPSFKLNTRPSGSLEGRSGEDVLEIILPTLRQAFADLVVETVPEKSTIDGRAAGHLQVRYILKVDDRAFPTVSEMWVVPRAGHFVIIGLGYGADDEDAAKTLRAVVASVRLTD